MALRMELWKKLRARVDGLERLVGVQDLLVRDSEVILRIVLDREDDEIHLSEALSEFPSDFLIAQLALITT